MCVRECPPIPPRATDARARALRRLRRLDSSATYATDATDAGRRRKPIARNRQNRRDSTPVLGPNRAHAGNGGNCRDKHSPRRSPQSPGSVRCYRGDAGMRAIARKAFPAHAPQPALRACGQCRRGVIGGHAPAPRPPLPHAWHRGLPPTVLRAGGRRNADFPALLAEPSSVKNRAGFGSALRWPCWHPSATDRALATP
jgi:hypothetical protein